MLSLSKPGCSCESTGQVETSLPEDDRPSIPCPRVRSKSVLTEMGGSYSVASRDSEASNYGFGSSNHLEYRLKRAPDDRSLD